MTRVAVATTATAVRGAGGGTTSTYGVLALPEACLETCLEAWSLCFFACGVRWVKFPCFVILDLCSVFSVGSHGWRQSVASTSFAHLSKQVLVEILKNKSISEMEISTVIEEQDPTWMTPIIEFISKGTLPHEQKDARRIRRTAHRFELRNGVLY
ncbi:hypothetical protein Tco_0387159 [Tanacetum coccineum]